jgi:hypothetical protein
MLAGTRKEGGRRYAKQTWVSFDESSKLATLARELAIASGYEKPFTVATTLRILLNDYYTLWWKAKGEGLRDMAGRVVEIKERMDKDEAHGA